MGVEQGVQGGEVGALRREDRLRHDPEIRPPDARSGGCAGSTSRTSGRRGLVPAAPSTASSRGTRLARRVNRVRPWNKSASTNGLSFGTAPRRESHAARGSAEDDDVLTGVVGRKRVETELGHEPVHAVLRRPDPLPAKLQRTVPSAVWPPSVRPPTRARASSTVTSSPAVHEAASWRRARPATPTPTTMTLGGS